MHDLATTLVAVGTPPGRGGLGCLRLSGSAATTIARSLFRPTGHGFPDPGAPPCFGRLVDRAGRPIDHGYLVLFAPRRSFTGEPSAELWTHGSPVILSELVQAALAAGAFPAGPGEFTYRALRNGRIDLAQAEAIRDLIEARTTYQARLALAQAEGALSRRLEPLRERLDETLARAEASVEFADEAETGLPRSALARSIAEARIECAELLVAFRAGRILRSGATAVIAGSPNVGKSSLFNRLVGTDRAIVTEIAGTTRDTLEAEIDMEGLLVHLIDTAGVRSAQDAVEEEGVRRAEAARRSADLVVLVLDGNAPGEAPENATDDRTLVVRNKIDLGGGAVVERADVEVSARTGHGLESLRREMRRRLVGVAPVEHPVVTDARQTLALERAEAALARAAAALEAGFSEELVIEDLREARARIGEITGGPSSEELLDRIFATFCIGK